jgi:hypothetical protein
MLNFIYHVIFGSSKDNFEIVLKYLKNLNVYSILFFFVG